MYISSPNLKLLLNLIIIAINIYRDLCYAKKKIECKMFCCYAASKASPHTYYSISLSVTFWRGLRPMSTLVHWSGPPASGLVFECRACAGHPRELGILILVAERVWWSRFLASKSPPMPRRPRLRHNMPQLIIQKAN